MIWNCWPTFTRSFKLFEAFLFFVSLFSYHFDKSFDFFFIIQIFALIWFDLSSKMTSNSLIMINLLISLFPVFFFAFFHQNQITFDCSLNSFQARFKLTIVQINRFQITLPFPIGHSCAFTSLPVRLFLDRRHHFMHLFVCFFLIHMTTKDQTHFFAHFKIAAYFTFPLFPFLIKSCWNLEFDLSQICTWHAFNHIFFFFFFFVKWHLHIFLRASPSTAAWFAFNTHAITGSTSSSDIFSKLNHLPTYTWMRLPFFAPFFFFPRLLLLLCVTLKRRFADSSWIQTWVSNFRYICFPERKHRLLLSFDSNCRAKFEPKEPKKAETRPGKEEKQIFRNKWINGYLP